MGFIQDLVSVLQPSIESPLALCATTVVAAVLYVLVLGVYRITLHPLAKFPGPKLAAFTQWYETYYEFFKSPGGQYLFHYRKLHEKYGPIIRLSPFEIHIQDSSFFEEMYSQSLPWDKPKELEHRFNNANGLFPTHNHEVHRHRRAALNPYFSKRAINNAVPMMQEQITKLCDRLRREYQGTGKIFRLDWMMGCIASDIIVRYCLNRGYNFFEAPDFKSPFIQALFDLLDGVHMITQFPWIATIFNSLPQGLVETLQPGLKSVNNYNQEMADQVADILSKKEKRNGSEQMNVFNALLDSDLPPEELTLTRLQQEAITVIGAGFDTTRYALSVAGFHIINTPSIYQRLREELKSAIPDPNNMPSLTDLEQLPYLTACIQECVRMSYGVSQRAFRISDHITLTYKNYVIPPGTVVSMDNYSVAHDEEIFPESFTFRPERWLGDPVAPDGKKLTRYLVSFGKGTRSCLGINLAYAEMYLTLANVFRNFDFELFETDRSSVDCYRDMFLPHVKPGSQGVRVKIN
ncbi:cytochrome P450 [Aspergillus caelatus]|uniref:Cytochrome P450 monooxygenase otaC n=1 Tax=Aspergillus caelatus TaxID=61420 RepID=A0A5N7ANC3_9EURO|nr:cytochrome P450 [Aspergillus caelatus]KAE8370766.1 cytochrome P450 [Aspergillus caelatus]